MRFIIFVLIIHCVLSDNTYQLDLNCEKVFERKKICFYYNFENNCWPWAIHNCEIVRRTVNDALCPRYDCPESFQNAILQKEYLAKQKVTTTSSHKLLPTTSTTPVPPTTQSTISTLLPHPSALPSQHEDTALEVALAGRSEITLPNQTVTKFLDYQNTKSESNQSVQMAIIDNASNLILSNDPCTSFDCHVVTVRGPVCKYFVKERFDINCFLPCLTDNCTVYTQYSVNCLVSYCQQNPDPPHPIPPSPIPPLPPANNQTWKLGIGLGVAILIIMGLLIVLAYKFCFRRTQQPLILPEAAPLNNSLINQNAQIPADFSVAGIIRAFDAELDLLGNIERAFDVEEGELIEMQNLLDRCRLPAIVEVNEEIEQGSNSDFSDVPLDSSLSTPESLEELDPLANHHVAASSLAVINPNFYARYIRNIQNQFQRERISEAFINNDLSSSNESGRNFEYFN